MQKFVAKVAQAGMASMIGYEVGQNMNQEEKQIIIKINKEDLLSKEDNDVSINQVIVIVVLVVILLILVLAIMKLFFNSQRKRSIANDARV